MKTIAGRVLEHRHHVATISRRLVNPQWKTRDWVERYLDLLLMGLLFLEQQRLRDMQRDGDTVGEIWVQARTTDRLRMLETLCHQCDVRYLEERLRTPGGTRRLLRELRRHVPCRVA